MSGERPRADDHDSPQDEPALPQPADCSDDDLLTCSQAAELAPVSARTIRRYGLLGILPSVVLPSGVRRYRRGDVLALSKIESP